MAPRFMRYLAGQSPFKKESRNHKTIPASVSVYHLKVSFTGASDGTESACNDGDPSSIPGSGRYPGKGSGNPLQNSCLGNPRDRGAWWAIVHGVMSWRL